MEDKAIAAFEAGRTLLIDVHGSLTNLKWEHISEALRKHIEAHPTLTAVQIGALLLALCPGIVVTPALHAAGFGSLGPISGRISAAYQSAHGATQASSTLQSAGMAGYGLPVINGIVQLPAGVTAAVAELTKWRKGAEESGTTRALVGKERAKL